MNVHESRHIAWAILVIIVALLAIGLIAQASQSLITGYKYSTYPTGDQCVDKIYDSLQNYLAPADCAFSAQKNTECRQMTYSHLFAICNELSRE